MKIKNLFVAALAVIGVAVACQPQQDQEETSLSVSTKKVEFTAAGGSQNITLETSSSWTITVDGSWLEVKELKGKGNATVTLTAPENKLYNREATLNIKSAGHKAAVTVTQVGEKGEYVAAEGAGTAESPYNIAQIAALVKDLTWESNTKCDEIGPFYVRGKISKVKNEFDFEYGTSNFEVTDNGLENANTLVGYQVKYLENKNWLPGNTQIAVGDVVVIYGKFMNYKAGTADATPENRTGAYIVDLNGATSDDKGEYPDYSQKEAKSMAEFIAAADENTIYKLTGTVTNVYSSTASFNFTDDEGTSVVQAYQVKNWELWSEKVAVGTIVTIGGKYKKYQKNESSPITHEAVSALILDVQEPTFDPTDVEEKTNAEFIRLAEENTYYILTGTATNFNKSFFSFDLTDAEGTTICVYSISNPSQWKDKVKYESTVKLAAKYQKYEKDGAVTHEAVNAFILDVQGGKDFTPSDPAGEGTLESPFNAAKALEVAQALEAGGVSEQEYYIAGKVSSIKYAFDAEHGTATFNISDDGTAQVTEFICYGVKYLDNKAWEEGDAQPAVGDDVVVYGKVQNYKAKNSTTPETKDAYLYSLNGQTKIEPSPVFRVESDAINVSASATSATIKVLGNVEWTASSEDATVAPEAGEGKGNVTVTFDANTDTEAEKTYTVTLSTEAEVAEKTITVTVTQGKASTAATVEINVSFESCPEGFPNGSGNGAKDGTHNLEGYNFTFHAADKYYWNSGKYILIGKNNSYIQLPAIAGKTLKTVSFKTGSGASTSVIVDLADANGTRLNVNTGALDKDKEYEWTVPNGVAGAAYRIQVCSAHNAQFQYINLIYE